MLNFRLIIKTLLLIISISCSHLPHSSMTRSVSSVEREQCKEFLFRIFPLAQNSHTRTNPARIKEEWVYKSQLLEEKSEFMRRGFTQYSISTKLTGPVKSAIYFINNLDDAQNIVIYKFINALENEREKLKSIYRLSDQDYLELSKLAIGILEVESKSGKSLKYYIKELFPNIVAFIKRILRKDYSINSRGLTQIKVVPRAIQEQYGLKQTDLSDPYHCAIATIGFLAQSLPELQAKIRKFNITSINDANYYDLLIYIYNGRSSQLINDSATPDNNIYIQRVNQIKTMVEIFLQQ